MRSFIFLEPEYIQQCCIDENKVFFCSHCGQTLPAAQIDAPSIKRYYRHGRPTDIVCVDCLPDMHKKKKTA